MIFVIVTKAFGIPVGGNDIQRDLTYELLSKSHIYDIYTHNVKCKHNLSLFTIPIALTTSYLSLNQ